MVSALLASAAVAAPVVVDPNFNETVTTAPYYYGIAGWGAAGLPASDPAYNPSFAGSIGFGVMNQWNNGLPGNGETKVGFIANAGGYIQQAISGFTAGESYSITLLANGRVASADYPLSSPAALTITTDAANYTLYSGVIAPVDPAGTQDAPFQVITGQAFTAYSSTITVVLTNTGARDSTVLLSGFAINDLGVAVPEPVSISFAATGLLALGLMRRRG
ncbi:MAG TPA: hypothetical protein VGC15_18180 [Acetobacteraceae bacterium]